MTPIVSSTLLRTQSDARLAQLAGGGSERAFEAIVERYRRPLARYCARLVGESRSEDVLQEVFVKAWNALRRDPEVTELRAWLYRIAHNTSLNALRKAGYDYVELQDSMRSSHSEPEAEQERRAVVLRTLAGVAALPEAQREALLRTAVDGLSQEEVARVMGVSEPAVRGLVYRAREALRAGATALMPPPLLNWLAGMGGSGGGSPRIAELVATGGGAAGVGLIAKAGAVVATGAIATGAFTVAKVVPHGPSTPAAEAEAAPPATRTPVSGAVTGVRGSDDVRRDDRRGRRGGDDHRGRGGGDDSGSHGGRDSSGSSGHGGGDDRAGSDDSGSRRSGSGTSDDGSGSSGSGSDDSSSGSGTSGSGTSGGSDDAPSLSTSGSGTSGSGGSGTSGSGGSGDSSTSGSGSSGSGSSGSGTSGSSGSSPDDSPSSDD